MSTQPVLELPPSIPPPQTVIGTLQQDGTETRILSMSPGERPFMQTHMARSVLISSFSVGTADNVGTQIFDVKFPQIPVTETAESAAKSDARYEFAYPQEFYYCQSVFWNAEVNYTVWAVKPPAAVGRMRLMFIPPDSLGSNTIVDNAQRSIMKEWDMSASNLLEFSSFGYNMRNFRSTMSTTVPNSLAFNYLKRPDNDSIIGKLSLYVANRYQPGSVFADSCHIYLFQHFSNPQFKIVKGLPTIREELATYA